MKVRWVSKDDMFWISACTFDFLIPGRRNEWIDRVCVDLSRGTHERRRITW